MKKKILRNIILLILGCFAMHHVSRGYLISEKFILSRVEQTASAVVLNLGDFLGMEPKKLPEPELGLIELVEKEALEQGVNPVLVRGILKIETGNRSYAISPKGAIGPMQIMPFNYKRCNLQHIGKLYDERVNIKCGVQIFKEELLTYKENVVKASKAYNGGAKCVKNRCSESEDYSRKLAEFVLNETPGLG